MASEKEKYAQMISQSELFSLDSKSEPSAYHRELLRMIENLYRYLMSFGREKYENYGLEITETAKRCIRNYDESQGPFLPYFVSAWKYEFSHITSDRMLDERLHGIKISEDDRRSVVRYIRLINSMETNLSLQEVFQRLSDSMGLPIKDIERIALIEGITISSDIVMDIDGNEFCVWDQIESGSDFSSEIEGAEAVSNWLNEVDSVFIQLQERQKPVVSDLLTIKLCGHIPYSVLNRRRYGFLNRSIVEAWHLSHELPSQKEIAEKYGRKEASVSRTLHEFLRKLTSFKCMSANLDC